ncbi:MAG: N-acetylmuramoyl-L-alanine amidase [candidate division KSB1 bacterium]|nr:N-acetylmuramoyl-L-alanine amidase [candidate division KSB1 bacterium]
MRPCRVMAGRSCRLLWALVLEGFVACAAVTVLPPQATRIAHVSYRAGTVAVEFSYRGHVSVRQHRWGQRLILDLSPCLVDRAGAVRVGDEYVVEYHWAQHDLRTVRVVVTPQVGKDARVRLQRDRLVVMVGGGTTPRPAQRPLMVLIDPGHGGSDTGGRGRRGTLEKDVTLDISLRLARRLLADRRFDVRMTRIDDTGPSLAARRDMVRALQPDLLISVHVNASRNPEKSKTEVYYYGSASRDLARHVGLALMNALGTEELVFGSRAFYVLRSNGASYSILVEPLYLSNDQDERLLASAAGRERIARVLHSALVSYFRQR